MVIRCDMSGYRSRVFRFESWLGYGDWLMLKTIALVLKTTKLCTPKQNSVNEMRQSGVLVELNSNLIMVLRPLWLRPG